MLVITATTADALLESSHSRTASLLLEKCNQISLELTTCRRQETKDIISIIEELRIESGRLSKPATANRQLDRLAPIDVSSVG
jgi:hypothetical protein